MNAATSFLKRLQSYKNNPAIVCSGKTFSYQDFLDRIAKWKEELEEYAVGPKQVVALRSDFTFESVSLFFALLEKGCVVVMLPDAKDYTPHFLATGPCAFFQFEGKTFTFKKCEARKKPTHPLLQAVFDSGEPGFIIFSSGSSGEPKVILHSLKAFTSKFKGDANPSTLVTFFLFDHIAGLDRLFLGLYQGGKLVFPEKRDPGSICALIEQHEVNVLPSSPSFLNLLLLSKEYTKVKFDSMRLLTYGSEPMSEVVLKQLKETFPDVAVVQTYGTSEIGSLRVQSRSETDLWMKPASDYYQLNVRDGILWVKTSTAMLGYLNRENPFDEEGWYCTEDLVEVDGDWFKILGRDSDMIIVGGEKVFPREVEAVIEEIEGVVACVVKGEENALMGNVVVATVQTQGEVDRKPFQKNVRKFCREHLPSYKVPVTINLTQESLVTERSKKKRG